MWPLIFKLHVFIVTSTLLAVMMPPRAYAVPLSRDIKGAERTIYYHNKPPNALGHYEYEFQTTNGITTKGAGNEYGAVGVVQYISLEGIPLTMTYVADANGYHPEGEHLPRTPLHIYKSLEYIRTHPPVDELKSRKL